MGRLRLREEEQEEGSRDRPGRMWCSDSRPSLMIRVTFSGSFFCFSRALSLSIYLIPDCMIMTAKISEDFFPSFRGIRW